MESDGVTGVETGAGIVEEGFCHTCPGDSRDEGEGDICLVGVEAAEEIVPDAGGFCTTSFLAARK